MSFQYVQPTEEQRALMQSFRDRYEAIAHEIKKLAFQSWSFLVTYKAERKLVLVK